jgi:hypothetical protein
MMNLHSPSPHQFAVPGIGFAVSFGLNVFDPAAFRHEPRPDRFNQEPEAAQRGRAEDLNVNH